MVHISISQNLLHPETKLIIQGDPLNMKEGKKHLRKLTFSSATHREALQSSSS